MVDRPASIVKELVENSLDAGAMRIDVSLEQGGLTSLAVRDNGRGIPAQELALAVTSHATSKLRSLADLMAINTLGFRGEALPSIGSVSVLRVTSVAAPVGEPGEAGGASPSPEAAFIELRFGAISAQGPAALDSGTLVEISELFANIPARLKFLKTASTELKRCREVLERLALNYLNVGFRLYSQGREVCNFPAGQSLAQRLGAMWPPDMVTAMRPVEFRREGLAVSGLTGDPALAQLKSDRLLFYVNGRPVQDRILPAAVRQAYTGKLLGRECPQAVLFVTLPPEEVDVNVHPAKAEVRFRDDRAVFSAVFRAVEQSLSQFSLGQSTLDFAGGASASTAPQAGLGAEAARRRPGFWGEADREYILRGHSQATDSTAGAKESSTFSDPTRLPAKDRDAPNPWESDTEESSWISGHQALGGMAENRADYDPDRAGREYLPSGPEFVPPDNSGEAAALAAPEQAAAQFAGPLPGLDYLGQIADTYLAASLNEDNLLLLDQHAVHEAVLYARLRRRGLSGESRPLALPFSLSLHPSEIEQLEAQREHFMALGFKLSREGELTVRLEGVPPDLSAGEAREFLQEVLSGRVEGLEDLWAMMACKAAVKAKAALTGDEARELLRQWAENPDARYCPHGRPTAVVLSRADLEKLFKRRA